MESICLVILLFGISAEMARLGELGMTHARAGVVTPTKALLAADV